MQTTIMSVTEYAKSRGITTQAVYWQIKNNRVRAHRLGKTWIIEVTEETK